MEEPSLHYHKLHHLAMWTGFGQSVRLWHVGMGKSKDMLEERQTPVKIATINFSMDTLHLLLFELQFN